MSDAIVSSVARALLQQLAGIMLGRGLITASEADIFVSIGLGVVALAWSIIARRRRALDTAAAVQAARAEIPAEVVPVLNQAAAAGREAREAAEQVRGLAADLGLTTSAGGSR